MTFLSQATPDLKILFDQAIALLNKAILHTQKTIDKVCASDDFSEGCLIRKNFDRRGALGVIEKIKVELDNQNKTIAVRYLDLAINRLKDTDDHYENTDWPNVKTSLEASLVQVKNAQSEALGRSIFMIAGIAAGITLALVAVFYFIKNR